MLFYVLAMQAYRWMGVLDNYEGKQFVFLAYVDVFTYLCHHKELKLLLWNDSAILKQQQTLLLTYNVLFTV